jgi:hypothetical protein
MEKFIIILGNTRTAFNQDGKPVEVFQPARSDYPTAASREAAEEIRDRWVARGTYNTVWIWEVNLS